LLKRANNPLSLVACLLAAAALAPAVALADDGTTGATGPTGSTGATGTTGTPGNTGGVSPNDPQFQPAEKGKIVNGMAIAPASAPPEVVQAIAAANKIARRPYRYGGGHRSFRSRGYDCSGAVSYALHGANLLDKPLDSSDFMKWGDAGPGKWITIYTNPGHAFVVIAGLRFDTGYRDRIAKASGAAPGSGPRWGGPRSTRGYVAVHPEGL
jgi:cell wall-associated NlpC family hydrolase